MIIKITIVWNLWRDARILYSISEVEPIRKARAIAHIQRPERLTEGIPHEGSEKIPILCYNVHYNMVIVWEAK